MRVVRGLLLENEPKKHVRSYAASFLSDPGTLEKGLEPHEYQCVGEIQCATSFFLLNRFQQGHLMFLIFQNLLATKKAISRMADQNAPPSNSADPAGGVANGIRIILGRNPVVQQRFVNPICYEIRISLSTIFSPDGLSRIGLEPLHIRACLGPIGRTLTRKTEKIGGNLFSFRKGEEKQSRKNAFRRGLNRKQKYRIKMYK